MIGISPAPSRMALPRVHLKAKMVASGRIPETEKNIQQLEPGRPLGRVRKIGKVWVGIDHGVVGSRCWLWEERWIADEGQCPCHFQVVGTSTLMVTRDFIYLFFLKVLLLIVFFLRTGLFPSSLGISIVFIEDLLNAQDCVKCLWVLFLWFMMSDYNPLGWGNSSEGTHLCLTDEATEVQRSEDNCPGNSE